MHPEFKQWLEQQIYFYYMGMVVSREPRSLIGGHWTWDEALIYYSIHR